MRENMAVSGHDTMPVFAVGSLDHLMIVDDRDPSVVDLMSAKLPNPAQGVRLAWESEGERERGREKYQGTFLHECKDSDA